MRIARLIAGLSSIAAGLAVPVLGLVWVYSSDYRRMRYAQLLDDPSRFLGLGWKVQLGFLVALALVAAGAFVTYSAVRSPQRPSG